MDSFKETRTKVLISLHQHKCDYFQFRFTPLCVSALLQSTMIWLSTRGPCTIIRLV